MRSCINKEVGELRLLRRALFGCFGTAQHSKRRATALQLLHDYTNTLVLETKGDCIQRLEDIQRNGGISMSEIDGEFCIDQVPSFALPPSTNFFVILLVCVLL